MKSNAELACFRLDRQVPNTGSSLVPACLRIDFPNKTNVIVLHSLLCGYKLYKYTCNTSDGIQPGGGARFECCFYKLQQKNAADFAFELEI